MITEEGQDLQKGKNNVTGNIPPNSRMHKHFLRICGTFNKIAVPEYKVNLNKFERIEIIQSILSDNDGIKLEITNRKAAVKSLNTWK